MKLPASSEAIRLPRHTMEYAKFFRKLLKGFTYVPRVQPSSSFRWHQCGCSPSGVGHR